jgi:hypothetical protein
MQALGYEVIQSGRGYGVEGDGAFAYFSTSDRLATLVELIQLPAQRYPPDGVYPRLDTAATRGRRLRGGPGHRATGCATWYVDLLGEAEQTGHEVV